MIRFREPEQRREDVVKRSLAGLLVVVVSGAAWPDGADAAPKKGQTGATSAPTSRPVKPKKVKVGEINKEMLGEWVSVRGTVRRVVERPSRTREQITIVTLHDGDSTIEAVYWADIAKQIPADQKPAAGEEFRVVGKVSEYRGRLQITLGSAEDLRKVKPKKGKPDESAGDSKGKGDGE